MINVKVTNEVNGRQFGANFETEAEAEAWVAKQKAKTSWGKPQHDVVVDVKEAPSARAIFKEDRTLTELTEQEGFEPVLDDESGEVMHYEKTQYVYTIPCEYTVAIEDLTQNYNWQLSNIISKRQAAYSKIDDLLKEAIVEKELGNMEKWEEYLELRSNIKIEFPKPSVKVD